ncbi:hypothetical protein BHE74_00049844, partial [Ensete ventricosum]
FLIDLNRYPSCGAAVVTDSRVRRGQMEQRLASTWRMTVNERKFVETALASDLRVDGRRPFDYRRLTIKFGRSVPVYVFTAFITNLIDAANIAALAALSTFRRPECTLGGENGQDIIVHDPEVKS